MEDGMPLVKMILGSRYQFDNVLVRKGEVIEVDARTRNRLVKGRHFEDVAEHERPAFTPMAEDPEEPSHVRGGVSLDDIDTAAQTGANAERLAEAPEDGPQGGRGKGTAHRRDNDAALNERATAGHQNPAPEAEEVEAEVS